MNIEGRQVYYLVSHSLSFKFSLTVTVASSLATKNGKTRDDIDGYCVSIDYIVSGRIPYRPLFCIQTTGPINFGLAPSFEGESLIYGSKSSLVLVLILPFYL